MKQRRGREGSSALVVSGSHRCCQQSAQVELDCGPRLMGGQTASCSNQQTSRCPGDTVKVSKEASA